MQRLTKYQLLLKDLVESSNDNAQEVLACFMNYVEVFDQTGEIREGVKEELAKEEKEEESEESNETSEDLQELETNEDFVYSLQGLNQFTFLGKGLGHSAPIQRLSWSPDERQIVTVSADCSVSVWNFFGAGQQQQ